MGSVAAQRMVLPALYPRPTSGGLEDDDRRCGSQRRNRRLDVARLRGVNSGVDNG